MIRKEIEPGSLWAERSSAASKDLVGNVFCAFSTGPVRLRKHIRQLECPDREEYESNGAVLSYSSTRSEHYTGTPKGRADSDG
jgi:hypothetical protein